MFGILFNMFITWTILTSKHFTGKTDILILTLAIADTLMCVGYAKVYCVTFRDEIEYRFVYRSQSYPPSVSCISFCDASACS